LVIFAPAAGRAQSANPPTPPPPSFVYQGKPLNLPLGQAVQQLNALGPIAYVDAQMTNEITGKPVHDRETIKVGATAGHLEFWSDDSLDGLALESSFDVPWNQVDGHNVYIVNNPENDQDNQIEVLTDGDFDIRNTYRNIDDHGHLAPLQQGDLDNMFTFDNSGDLPRARHIADLLATLITLANAANPPPAPLADTAPAGTPAAATPLPPGAIAATPLPPGAIAATPLPPGAVAATPLPPGAIAAPGVTLTDVAPPKPAAPYVHPATSYFEGNFAVRVTPRPDGSAGVDVINISTTTHHVAVSVTACQNIAGGGCGAKFTGPLAPGMKLSFPISGNNITQPWDFHVAAAQNGA
jgi:hypothetical protein